VDILRSQDLERLAAAGPSPCVSVFLPTHRVGPETDQDRIRLKNLLGEAEGQLRALGLRSPEVSKLLRPAAALLDMSAFWRHQADGLALFVRPQAFRAFRLPLPFADLAVVGDRFHLKPLLPYFGVDGRFFVLALSQNEIRLLEGSRYSVDEVELSDAPRSLEEALRHEDPESQLLLHVSGGGPGGRAIFHGHGMGGEVERERLVRFFRAVDRGLAEILRGEQAPIVLAGVEYATAIYREVSSYPRLAENVIAGNPEDLPVDELHRRAWAILEPGFRATIESDVERFRELDGTGLTSREPIEILSSAKTGRVAVLFAAVNEARWGIVTDQAIQIHEERQPGDEDLIDAAVIAGLTTQARIHVLPGESLPARPIAAILRY
jgi:hypothetical protein